MKKSKRRQDSLIPLSRQHHYALVLCLRINRGLKTNGGDINWLRSQSRKATQFFESDLVPHFQAEEAVLFPAMSAMLNAAQLLSSLLDEHKNIREQIGLLRRLEMEREPAVIAKALIDLASMLEAHIRKEERQLFPIYEDQASSTNDAAVGEKILELIGTASQPSDPSLLNLATQVQKRTSE